MEKQRAPFIHITKKQNISNINKWIIRISTIVIAFFICSLISTIMGSSFPDFFRLFFTVNFGNINLIVTLLEKTSILVLISIALIPAFKMKFWNIGAEGQITAGIIVCTILQKYLSESIDLGNSAARLFFFVIVFTGSILAGAIWGVIPALFKAKFNTNETLFTLMMNYIAIIFGNMLIKFWSPDRGVVEKFNSLAYFSNLGNLRGFYNIIFVAVIAVAMIIYLKYTKHGYEIAVVGESRNTASYIGINYNKVIIRTMLLSGALCGLCGCLLIVGEGNSMSNSIVAGRGFTGVMIAWIGSLNPLATIFYSFISALVLNGSSAVNYRSGFSNIMVCIIFFSLVASDFFIRYKIHCEKLSKFNIFKRKIKTNKEVTK